MKTRYTALLTSLIGLGSLTASAGTTTTFGSLPAANFGGTGDPNNAVETTTITGLPGGNSITLGLEGQQRYQNPALGNNGNGTYYAQTGANYGNPANPTSTADSTILGSTWNFDFYANISGGATLANYTFVLEYPLAPGTPTGSLGTVNLNNAAIATLVGGGLSLGTATADVDGTSTIQNSENLDFGSFATPLPGVVSPPAGSFNPGVTGDYTFVLDAYSGNTLVGSDEITVDVVPDAASTSALLGGSFVALAGLRRRLGRA